MKLIYLTFVLLASMPICAMRSDKEMGVCFATNGRDSQGRIALHRAAIRGDMSEIERLVQSGLDFDAQDGEGNTPLFYAVAYGRGQAVIALLRHANPDLPNRAGLTPRMLAREGAYLRIPFSLEGNRCFGSVIYREVTAPVNPELLALIEHEMADRRQRIAIAQPALAQYLIPALVQMIISLLPSGQLPDLSRRKR